jgi:hypothetical protein
MKQSECRTAKSISPNYTRKETASFGDPNRERRDCANGNVRDADGSVRSSLGYRDESCKILS